LLDWGGEGPLALLHHANGFCAALWAPVAEALRRDFRVIAMDARGHGDSSKPEGAAFYSWEAFGQDLAAVAEALAAEHPDGRVGLGLGHSFGGTSMLMAAAARPDLFARLVLVDPVLGLRVSSPERTQRGKELSEGARSRRRIFRSREEAGEAWRRKPLFASWRPESLELYLAEGLADREDGRVELKCPPEVEASVFERGRTFDIWSVAERVRTPARLLWAERGDFPRSLFEELAEHLADAEIEDVPAGHLFPMERPELVVEAVRAFVPGAHSSIG
jgi:pimeloyl-ACP methyl ester carboxylesterase